MNARTIDSPLGPLTIEEQGGRIAALRWEAAASPSPSPLLQAAADGLMAYFAGDVLPTDLPLAPQGTPFQQRVWSELQTIPHGRTMTYGQLADRLGSHARAVGQACGANPIPILIPCHRVLSASGQLTGFSGRGGCETKRWLLDHEAAPGLFAASPTSFAAEPNAMAGVIMSR